MNIINSKTNDVAAPLKKYASDRNVGIYGWLNDEVDDRYIVVTIVKNSDDHSDAGIYFRFEAPLHGWIAAESSIPENIGYDMSGFEAPSEIDMTDTRTVKAMINYISKHSELF